MAQERKKCHFCNFSTGNYWNFQIKCSGRAKLKMLEMIKSAAATTATINNNNDDEEEFYY